MKRKAALAALGASIVPRAVLGQSAAAAPYKIGLTIPLTGPYTSTVAEYLPAYELGIAAVNAAGGINGHQLKLLVEDSQASPQGGISAMRKLVEVDGVTAMMTIFTNVLLAQIPLADQLQMPVMAITEISGVIGAARFTFAHGTPVDRIHPLFGKYWKLHGYKRIYAFFGNNAQGPMTADSLRDFARVGGTELQSAFLNLSETDFRGEIARAKDYNPDGIFMNTSGSTADAILLKQLRESGVNAQLFAENNFYTVHAWRTAAGNYTEGMIFGGPKVDPRAARDFVQTYKSQLGFEPGYATAEMYDAVHILANAIGRGGSTGTGIRDALATVKGLPSSLGGTLAMGPDHYTIVAAIALWQVRRGEEVRIYPT